MKDRFSFIVALIVLLVLTLATWWASEYAKEAIKVDPPAVKNHEPDSWSKSFIIVQTNEQGFPVNRLEGQQMRHYPDDDSYQVEQPVATGLQANNPLTIGTAKLGTMLDNGNKILLQGDAHVHRVPSATDKALDITSEELTIYPQKDIITTDKPSIIINGNSRLNGKGMTYNNKTRKLDVYANTDVKISGQDVQERQEQKNADTRQDQSDK